VLWDNGQFSAFTQGKPFDEPGFIAWVEPRLGHPHWAVIPDVIDGTEAQQREMIARWPFGKWLGAPVWHLGLSIDWLLELAAEWPRICWGSSAQGSGPTRRSMRWNSEDYARGFTCSGASPSAATSGHSLRQTA
jgi:hypothetical protein